MPHVLEYLLRELKMARERKGLSQRELAAKTGFPQNHISKIENADVDLKVSSLIEIARVLDLELFLVPRQMIPAIQAMQRSTHSDRSSALGRNIRKQIGRLISRTERFATRQPNNVATHQLVAALTRLRESPITKDVADAVQQQLDEIRQMFDRVARHRTQDGHRSDEQTFGDHVRELSRLELKIAFSNTADQDERRPAYQLCDETD